ncbi:MarR family winged helix-turn-helix transcriptional regulator [Roseibium suaedae]|uniref:DNA-binding transcriptional regulator, MarR family n=1 Tax=Roseibium suaedae TaxID=735517 RepID=A0A1M6YST9_9HYPH|nr:MarR family transcriptional regulator [Roseibium suaedae]SHL21200.1 DNA-binding transcriptional regulator, MarR family [Roseibium suaedae]
MLNDLELAAGDVQGGGKMELRLWLRLLSTTKLISQELRRRLRIEFNVTLPQFDVLAQLHREPDGLRLGDLSQRTMVTNGNITGLVERLETDGLLVRERLREDRRVTVARLTEHGRSEFERMAHAHESWLKELMRDMDPEVLTSLFSHVSEIKHAALTRFAATDELDGALD